MADHWDEKEQAKQEAILRALTSPKTLRDLADEFRVSYPTIWRKVKALRDRGLVKELPFGEGKQSRFVRMHMAGDEGSVEYKVLGKNGAIRLVKIATDWDDPVVSVMDIEKRIESLEKLAAKFVNLRDISGVVSQIYRYSRFASATDKTEAFAGSKPPNDCKAYLRELLEWLEAVQSLVRQLVLEAPIWEEVLGQPSIIERFGVVTDEQAELMITLGSQFERRHP